MSHDQQYPTPITPAPVFPGDQLEQFLASSLASTNPWTALQDALWEFGVTTHQVVEPAAVDPQLSVNAPGETWPERIRWRRQNCRPTHILRIEETCGRTWQDWQTVLQWAAAFQFQAFSHVKGNDAAMEACFGSEHIRYVIEVDGKTFDYPLRDAYEPLTWKAWRSLNGHDLVKQFGQVLEPQDMDAVLAEYLMRYQGRGPSAEEAQIEHTVEQAERAKANAAGREYVPLAYPRPWRSWPWVPLVGYLGWREGRFKGLYAATINAYTEIVNPSSLDSMIPSGYFAPTGDGSDEQMNMLDHIAASGRIAHPSTVPPPGSELLKRDVWAALNAAARDDVDTEIIRRRWLPYDKPPFSEPFAAIAKDLGITPQAVSKRWRRLRAEVEDLLPEPVRRERAAYGKGERQILRANQQENWLRSDLIAPQPVRLLSPETDPEAFAMPTIGQLRACRVPLDDELDAVQLAHGLGGFASGCRTVDFPTLGLIARSAQWGLKGVLSTLMDSTVRNDALTARESQDGYTDDHGGFMSADGFPRPMPWRPGEASRAQRVRLSSIKKLTQATEEGDAEWDSPLSKHLRTKETWTIHGLGRRGPDGPAGTESAGFGDLGL